MKSGLVGLVRKSTEKLSEFYGKELKMDKYS